MPTPARAGELKQAVRTLVGYVDDLRKVRFDDAMTKLRLVVNYCQKDPVVRAMSEQLRGRMPTHELHERTMQGDALRPPEDPLERLAYLHTLLFHIKQGWKLELREILGRTRKGSGMEDRWAGFQADLIAEYAQLLQRVLAWVDARAGDGMVDADEVFAQALGSLADPAKDAPEPAPAPESTVPASPDLLAAIDAAGLPADVAADLRVDAQLVALELRKSKPSPARLAELDRSFAAASQALATALHGVLGGQAAYVKQHGGASIRDADARRADEVAADRPKRKPTTKTAAVKKKPSTARTPAAKKADAPKKAGPKRGRSPTRKKA